MRFEDAYEGWTSTRLTPIDAARLLGEGGRAPRRSLRWMLRLRAAWRCGFYRVIPRVVAESRNPGLKSFYGPFWMLRLRAA